MGRPASGRTETGDQGRRRVKTQAGASVFSAPALKGLNYSWGHFDLPDLSLTQAAARYNSKLCALRGGHNPTANPPRLSANGPYRLHPRRGPRQCRCRTSNLGDCFSLSSLPTFVHCKPHRAGSSWCQPRHPAVVPPSIPNHSPTSPLESREKSRHPSTAERRIDRKTPAPRYRGPLGTSGRIGSGTGVGHRRGSWRWAVGIGCTRGRGSRSVTASGIDPSTTSYKCKRSICWGFTMYIYV
jgi:hypothetical protein